MNFSICGTDLTSHLSPSILKSELLRPEGLAKPIPSLTLTLPDSDPSHASETHRLSSTAGPSGGALSSQELRRMSMMPPQSVKAGGRG